MVFFSITSTMPLRKQKARNDVGTSTSQREELMTGVINVESSLPPREATLTNIQTEMHERVNMLRKLAPQSPPMSTTAELCAREGSQGQSILSLTYRTIGGALGVMSAFGLLGYATAVGTLIAAAFSQLAAWQMTTPTLRVPTTCNKLRQRGALLCLRLPCPTLVLLRGCYPHARAD